MVRLCLTFLVLCSLGPPADAATAAWRQYTRGKLVAETSAIAPGQSGAVGLRLGLEPEWHTYWINPGDSGTPPRLKIRAGDPLTVRRVAVPRPDRFENGPLITFGYAREVLFPIEFDVAASARPGSTARIEVEAEWLVCKDICIPAVDRFEIELPVRALDAVEPSEDFAAFQRARARVPVVRPEYPRWKDGKADARLTLGSSTTDRDFTDFFPFRGSGVSNEAPVLALSGDSVNVVFAKSNVPRADPARVGVLVTRDKASRRIEATQFGESGWTWDLEAEAAPARDLWWMLVSAFVGGLILNLMPCVFPILSIKLLGLLKLVDSRPGFVRTQNAAYVAGVLASFLAIAGVLASLRAAGAQVGWGFQLQSPLFLIALIWLFFALALNLFGVFEIEWLGAGFGHRLTRFDGALGSFFTGVLAVVVASPCTAPFMGVALGFGLAQPTPVLIAIFTSLGLGLAFPYLVFTVRPGWIRVLPRPGRWMSRLKQVMAFPLLFTDLWLVWVLGAVRGPDAMVVALAGCVMLGLALWFSRVHRQWAAWAALLSLILGAAFIARDDQYRAQTAASDVWQPYSPHVLDALKGQNVLVDMTAEWCLTCKVNDRLVFRDAEVMKRLEERKVHLVRGDWTQRNPEITQFLEKFSRVGVPFYVLYSRKHPHGRPLPELLTKTSFLRAVDEEFAD